MSLATVYSTVPKSFIILDAATKCAVLYPVSDLGPCPPLRAGPHSPQRASAAPEIFNAGGVGRQAGIHRRRRSGSSGDAVFGARKFFGVSVAGVDDSAAAVDGSTSVSGHVLDSWSRRAGRPPRTERSAKFSRADSHSAISGLDGNKNIT